MLKTLLYIGAGSFLGGAARYGLSRWIQPRAEGSFPIGTLAVNLAGCLLIGLLYGWFARGHITDPALRAGLATGFCGGLTTFSSFAAEGLSMFHCGHFLSLAAYATLSFALGLCMVYLGQMLARGV